MLKPSFKKTALFFGSFNPIHNGHLIIAQHFVNHLDIHELWFVVSPKNPLKEKKTLISEYQRFYMVQEAIEDNPKFRACDIEFQLDKPSYTAHTLSYLQEKYPDRQFFLILGEDNLSDFYRWKNYEYILEHFDLLVYPRPNCTKNELYRHPKVHFTDAPLMEISASKIREQIRSNLSIKYLVPDKVLKYIEDMNLYKTL